MTGRSEIDKKGLGREVLSLHLSGKPSREIGTELGIGYKGVQAYIKAIQEPTKAKNGKVSRKLPTLELLENHVRLEISQESALSELSKQLEDYTIEYERAPDDKAKYAWSQNRIRILQEMNKVTGLYEPRPCNIAPTPIIENTEDTYTTEELREIIEFEEKHPLRADKKE
ncbi:MAG: hypothetical protein WC455_29555 [Dehalococcoidia bacterium]